MCTLYTFTADKKSAFIRQIAFDAAFNSDGFSCLFERDGRYSLIRTEEIDFLIDIIATTDADRYFVHLRMATTSFKGVTRCHGLDGGDFTIFHNGVIDYGGDLDSRGIAEIFAKHDIDFALRAIEGFSYANIIAVNTQTGEYFINKSSIGTLFTDGEGNYSTTMIKGTCAIPVDIGSYSHGTVEPMETEEIDLEYRDYRIDDFIPLSYRGKSWK